MPALRNQTLPPSFVVRLISRIWKSSSFLRCSYAASGVVSSSSSAVVFGAGRGVEAGKGVNHCGMRSQRLKKEASWLELTSMESMTIVAVSEASGRPRRTSIMVEVC